MITKTGTGALLPGVTVHHGISTGEHFRTGLILQQDLPHFHAKFVDASQRLLILVRDNVEFVIMLKKIFLRIKITKCKEK